MRDSFCSAVHTKQAAAQHAGMWVLRQDSKQQYFGKQTAAAPAAAVSVVPAMCSVNVFSHKGRLITYHTCCSTAQ